jgi:hypothetical protein
LPKRFSNKATGALPGLKPGILTLVLSFSKELTISRSIMSKGISIRMRFFVVVMSSTDLSKFNLPNISFTVKYALILCQFKEIEKFYML